MIPYDLKLLCKKVPELEAFVSTDYTRIRLDSPKAVKYLNQALVLQHLNLSYWNFPDKHLTPPYPSRFEYLNIIQKEVPEIQKIFDIGTGATAIYPLIAVQKFDWEVCASEIDPLSLQNAKRIISKNGIDKITLRHQKKPRQILNGVVEENESFDIAICNPPFFHSPEEATKQNQRRNKLDKIPGAFSGTNSELVYEFGGELGFLKTYIRESQFYKDQFRYFSSLVSSKSYLRPLKVFIKKQKGQATQLTLKTKNKTQYILIWHYPN